MENVQTPPSNLLPSAAGIKVPGRSTPSLRTHRTLPTKGFRKNFAPYPWIFFADSQHDYSPWF